MARDWMLMRCPLSLSVEPASWPQGYCLTDLREGGSAAFHRLLAEVYEGDPDLLPYEEWWRAVSNDSEFDAALCFLLLAQDGRPAAAALNWNSGFVKDLAVAPGHRRLGLGRALLLHSLAAFRQRGIEWAALKVQKANPHKAWKLYESVGFREADPEDAVT
jgi:ribosomal protein S18 acetylase RimI-like enzyme